MLLPFATAVACLSGRFYQLMCRGRLCRCILVVPSLAGCCFMLSCPLFRCFTRAAVVLRAVEGGADVSIHATLAALPCVASRSPEHARVLGGGTQAPAALLPFSAPDLPACALLCRFHPPLPPQVSLEQVRGLSPSTLTCGPPVRVKVKKKKAFLAMPFLAGCCFPLSSPFLLLYPGSGCTACR